MLASLSARRGVEEALRRALGRVQQGRLERRRDQRLEVAPADLGVGVLRRDHLALLGQADLAVHRARRLRQDRLVARAAAASDGAAAAVEQAQRDAVRRAAPPNSSTSAVSARYSSQLLVKQPPSLLLSL